MKPEHFASAAAIILILYIIFKICLSRRHSYKNNNFLPYRKKLLLTKNEWAFYKRLKPIADKYEMGIIAKIRLADLIEVDTNKTKEFNKFFPKISSKHIDFGLVYPDNMEVKYLIELDDRSHNLPKRKERDDFINKVCEKTGYNLIRTYGNIEDIELILKSDIKKHIN